MSTHRHYWIEDSGKPKPSGERKRGEIIAEKYRIGNDSSPRTTQTIGKDETGHPEGSPRQDFENEIQSDKSEVTS